MRRPKFVQSRAVSSTEIVVIDVPSQVTYPPAPAFEDLKDPQGPAAIDPSEIGRHSPSRPHRHKFRYRFAQLSTAATLTWTAGAIIAVVMSDRVVANIMGLSSVVAGSIAVYLAMRSRMASKILGYAIAAASLSAIATILILTLPKDWFEERHPEHLPPPSDYRPARQTQ